MCVPGSGTFRLNKTPWKYNKFSYRFVFNTRLFKIYYIIRLYSTFLVLSDKSIIRLCFLVKDLPFFFQGSNHHFLFGFFSFFHTLFLSFLIRFLSFPLVILYVRSSFCRTSFSFLSFPFFLSSFCLSLTPSWIIFFLFLSLSPFFFLFSSFSFYASFHSHFSPLSLIFLSLLISVFLSLFFLSSV